MAHSPRRPAVPRLVTWLLALGGFAVLLSVFVAVRLLPPGDAPEAVAVPGEPLLVFAEFGVNEDRIYVAPASNLDQRTEIASVAHASGWGINPGLAMAGDLFAYTVLPPASEGRRDAPAELWIMDAATRDHTRLARDADLLIQPVFVDGGAGLLYRRSGTEQQEIVRVDIAAQTRRVLHAERTAFGMYPIGLDPSGALLFARLSTAGTDVLSVRPGRAPALVFHASDHIARDWRLSPDGTVLSYLAPEIQGESVVHRARAVSLRTGQDQALPAVAPTSEQYGPTWTPDGQALTAGIAATGGPAPAVLLGLDGSSGALAAPERGFDVPVSWSPDGRYVAVRWFDGVNSARPGFERAVVIERDGGRRPVSDREVIVIGWIARA